MRLCLWTLETPLFVIARCTANPFESHSFGNCQCIEFTLDFEKEKNTNTPQKHVSLQWFHYKYINIKYKLKSESRGSVPWGEIAFMIRLWFNTCNWSVIIWGNVISLKRTLPKTEYDQGMRGAQYPNHEVINWSIWWMTIKDNVFNILWYFSTWRCH